MYTLLVQSTEAQTTRVTNFILSMPGKRLSLVCCWGPAAFHFPGGICCNVLGEGRFALSLNSDCMAKLV